MSLLNEVFCSVEEEIHDGLQKERPDVQYLRILDALRSDLLEAIVRGSQIEAIYYT